MKKIILFLSVLCAMICASSRCWNSRKGSPAEAASEELAQIPDFKITTPPDSLNLDPFYKKYVNVNGIHIASSWRVPDSAIVQCCRIVYYMTKDLPAPVMKALTEHKTRMTIMARYEGTTDVPEHRYLAQDTSINWDLRARGLGGDLTLPLTSCAEENLLGYQIDKYHAEDITIHEFAHSIHLIGICSVDTAINTQLKKSMDAAIAAGKYTNTYAITDTAEYFAEGVQDWFNVNAEMPKPDGKHNPLNTREELKRYDPTLYEIISRYFPTTYKQISKHKFVNEYEI
jgi:hypothetical protein